MTSSDAEDIVQLMMLSVIHVNSDAKGEIDTTRGGVGGASKMGEKKKFVNELRRMKAQFRISEFTFRDCQGAAHNSLNLDTNLKDVLEELRGSELVKTKNDEDEYVWKLID